MYDDMRNYLLMNPETRKEEIQHMYKECLGQDPLLDPDTRKEEIRHVFLYLTRNAPKSKFNSFEFL